MPPGLLPSTQRISIIQPQSRTLTGNSRTTARPEYGRAFEFGSFAAGKKGELRELSVKVNLAEIPDPQAYIVKVLLLRDGDSSVAPQVFDLKFTRPAATLSVSPLRLENGRLFPMFGVSTLSPDQLKLQETSRRATPVDVQIRVKDYLKGPDDASIPVQLQVPAIDKIDAGKESSTKLAFIGTLPLGSTKGTLVVSSRQLALPLEVAIEIVSRTCRFWLLAAIAFSIVLGYFFRTIPEKRRTENQSRIAAERQFGLIQNLKSKAIEGDLRAKLDDILQTLRNAIDAKPFVAATLDGAVKRAADDVDVEMKAAETERGALRTRINDLRVKLDSPEGQPGVVAQAVADRIARLEKQNRELKDGAVESVKTELDNIDSEIKNNIPTVIATWVQELHRALEQMGQWQALEFEGVRKKLIDETADPTKIDAIDLSKTRKLARDAQIFVLVAGLLQSTEIGTQVLDRLERLNLPGLKPKLDACRTCLDSARDLRDFTINRAGEVAGAVGNLRAALIEAIGEAAAIKKVAKPEGLDDGDFAKAMANLSGSLTPQERAWGPGDQKVPEAIAPLVPGLGSSALLSAAIAVQSKISSSWWDLQLSAQVNSEAGEQVVATAAVVGTSPGVVDLEWTMGNSITHSASGTQIFTPAEPGVLAISVRGVARSTGEVRTASSVIQVRAAQGFAAASRLADQLARDEIIQTIVSGVFITAAGYAIFQANWYGTFMDFFATMLWGFSVDVSVAKVRDIASPVLGRAVPLPAAKQ